MHRLLHDPIIILLILGSLISWSIILWSAFTLFKVTVSDQTPSAESCLSTLHAIIKTHQQDNTEHLQAILEEKIGTFRHTIEAPLAFLGSLGSISPYIGLLGTVGGIIHAFQAIQLHNNMSPSIVSGGIAMALISTAAGLAVAIPAVFFHNIITSALTRRVEFWEEIITSELFENREHEYNSKAA